MSDVVKRLREAGILPLHLRLLRLEAADEIERLDAAWSNCSRACARVQGERDAARAEIERLREERNAARNDALEEAAKVCDDARVAWAQKHGNPVTNPFDAGHTSAYLLAADAIRAMKGKENSDE